jgi:23S rRNA (uracil1939-C5)-methyltransferase
LTLWRIHELIIERKEEIILSESVKIQQSCNSDNPIKKGQIVDLKIEEFKFPSVGIGRASSISVPEEHATLTRDGRERPKLAVDSDTRRVLVKNVFPGQTARVRITKNREDRVEANLMEILERADYEVDAPCPHFGACGGCLMQSIPYEKQLEIKKDAVMGLFQGADVTDFEFTGIVPSPKQFEYRNKMELSFGNECKDGDMRLGLHKKNRYFDTIDIDGCLLMDEDFRKITKYVKEYALRNGLTHYNRKTHEGFLRNLVLRRGENTGEILVALSASTQVAHDFSDLVDTLVKSSCLGGDLKLRGTVVGVLLVENDSMGDSVAGAYRTLYGRDYYFEEMMGLTFKVSLYSFFQTNTKSAENLYNLAMDFTGDIGGKVVYDLFSGTGTIGQIAAMESKHVVGAEIVADAVMAARENAGLNGIQNADFLVGDVFDILNRAEEHELPHPDAIIVDPPRNGMSDNTLEKVLSYGIDEITYISCNPKSLLDNVILARKLGYRMVKMGLVDQFPHTAHVEVVALLTRSGATQ